LFIVNNRYSGSGGSREVGKVSENFGEV
jgi:hypothetical protein